MSWDETKFLEDRAVAVERFDCDGAARMCNELIAASDHNIRMLSPNPPRSGGSIPERGVEPVSVLPFSLEADLAELELLARNLLENLSIDAGIQIVEGNGEVGMEAERRFRLRWWATGDEALPKALHQAKTFVYQQAREGGRWPRLTEAWQSVEKEIYSDRWRLHARRLLQELPSSEQAYARLACRAAQQAISRAARWRSVLPDAPAPFHPLVELFARGAWPLGCHGGSLWVFLWRPQALGSPHFGPPRMALEAKPEDRRLFLSAPFRNRELSARWERALRDRGWCVVHGPVCEKARPPEVQLGHRIQEASAVLGLLDELDPDFGLPWWMFQELDYACACGQPVALVGEGYLSESELPDIYRVDAKLGEPVEVIEQRQFSDWLQQAAQVERGDRAVSKLAVALLAAWLFAFCNLFAAAQPVDFLSSPPAQESQAGAGAASLPDPVKQKLEIEKLQVELDKLKEETQELKVGNAAIGRITRQATAWGSAIGSLFGAVVTFLVAVIGFRLSRTQREKVAQDKDLERERHSLETRKLKQERAQGRQKHLLEIFRDLGSDKERIRMGAVAILVQMIRDIQSGNAMDSEDRHDLPTIVSTLILASKHEEKVAVQKQIADGLAQGLAVLVPAGEGPSSKASPLQAYDFQGARLEEAWWKRIDAREVDFYKARLARAGLRQAFLSGAVLMMADLRGATLEEAHLEGANLQRADLTDARAARANLRGANLEGADLTEADLREADLSTARLAGAKLQDARLAGAILIGTDLNAINLEGVDLSGAILE